MKLFYFFMCITVHVFLHSLISSGWSVANVTTEQQTYIGDQSIVQCSSSHLTSFAVLVDVRGAKVYI